MTDDRAYALQQANGTSLGDILKQVRRLAWREGWNARGDADMVWEAGSDKNPYDDEPSD